MTASPLEVMERSSIGHAIATEPGTPKQTKTHLLNPQAPMVRTATRCSTLAKQESHALDMQSTMSLRKQYLPTANSQNSEANESTPGCATMTSPTLWGP